MQREPRVHAPLTQLRRQTILAVGQEDATLVKVSCCLSMRSIGALTQRVHWGASICTTQHCGALPPITLIATIRGYTRAQIAEGVSTVRRMMYERGRVHSCDDVLGVMQPRC